jgi:hypothetical protein
VLRGLNRAELVKKVGEDFVQISVDDALDAVGAAQAEAREKKLDV